MSTKNFSNKFQQYLKNPDSSLSARNQLLDNCLILLKENERPPRRILDTMFIDILIESSKAATFDPDKAATAFCHIEEYVELLYRYPWKREFWNIKHHCGFYRTMINPWLKRAEEIFKKIGYQFVNGDCFQLQSEPNSSLLVDIGTQCLLASAECSLLSEACRLADSTNYMPTLVLHLDNGGTSKDIVAKLRSNNENMFMDPDKDLYISDLPLEYSLTDLRHARHSLKSNQLQNFGHTYASNYPLSSVNDIFLPQKTYTEEQQAALESYRRPHTQNGPQFQPGLKLDPFQRTSATLDFPINITADGSNYEKDSAYGGSACGDSLHGGATTENPAPTLTHLSQTQHRPREAMEHSLEKSSEVENISISGRTLTATQLAELAGKGSAGSPLATNLAPLSLLTSSSSSSSSSSPTGWTCNTCSYINLTDDSICKICSEIRLSLPSQPLQPRNSERICEKCTLKNKVTARKCKACGQTFKGYHTAV